MIGGGITGCGLARDAALRGLSVGLVEKADFGSGTSSRSSKLVHGGVRYLAYGDVALVRESAHERAVLGTIAPHLVHPLPFVFPLFKGDSTAKMRVGFTMFDRLANSAPHQRHRVLKAAEVRELVPALREPLTGGIRFMEYITDDARLTLENAMSAAQHGAFVANYAAVTSFLVEDGRLVGARVRDELDGETRDVRADGGRERHRAVGGGDDRPRRLARAEARAAAARGSTSCSGPSACRSRGPRPSSRRPDARGSRSGAGATSTSARPTWRTRAAWTGRSPTGRRWTTSCA